MFEYEFGHYLEDVHHIQELLLHRRFPYVVAVPRGGLILATHLSMSSPTNMGLLVLGADNKVKPSLDPLLLIVDCATIPTMLNPIFLANPTCAFEVCSLLYNPTAAHVMEAQGVDFFWRGRPLLNSSVRFWWQK